MLHSQYTNDETCYYLKIFALLMLIDYIPFRKNYICLSDISLCCLIYSFKKVVRNSLATFSHCEIGMLIFVSLCFNQCHFQSNHTFNIYANRMLEFSGTAQKVQLVQHQEHVFQGVLFSERSTNLFFFICTLCHNFVFYCDVNISSDMLIIEMHQQGSQFFIVFERASMARHAKQKLKAHTIVQLCKQMMEA